MIRIEKLSKSFGGQKVLDNLDLKIGDGEKIILLGQNGAGKTTLIRCILGEYRPDTGFVAIRGVSPFTDRVRAIADIAFVPQLPPPLRLTVLEIIQYAAGLSGFDACDAVDLCSAMQLDLRPHLKKTFYKLSGGMKQKVLISIALARKSRILILDEPTANLDTIGRKQFLELAEERCGDKSIIFICHRAEEVKNLVTRMIFMDMGKIISDETI